MEDRFEEVEEFRVEGLVEGVEVGVAGCVECVDFDVKA